MIFSFYGFPLKIVLNIEEKIKKMVFTDISSKVALLTASGTGAMDSVICNCLDENDKVLIINGGTFGNRFCELCKIYKIAYDEINLKFEEKLSQNHIFTHQYRGGCHAERLYIRQNSQKLSSSALGCIIQK